MAASIIDILGEVGLRDPEGRGLFHHLCGGAGKEKQEKSKEERSRSEESQRIPLLMLCLEIITKNTEKSNV
jgi:hypothetical protein